MEHTETDIFMVVVAGGEAAMVEVLSTLVTKAVVVLPGCER